jgi:quercetin dioxygenase-like cupin family protein
MEKHAVARLIGAPPGYVGFEQGGLLVDAVRTHPYSVVLLDEIEKAHHDLYNILLQVMDHATLTDNTGRKADFRNVVLILTSNAGSREMSAASIGFADGAKGDVPGDGIRRAAASKSKAAIERVFSPEFRNRLDAIVTFRPLTTTVMQDIVEKLDGKDARVTVEEVAIEPGGRVARHRHAGPVFGYVLEGEYEHALNDDPVTTYRAGDTFYEPSGCVHRVTRNPSARAKTRLLAVILHPRDAKEVTVPEKAKKK